MTRPKTNDGKSRSVAQRKSNTQSRAAAKRQAVINQMDDSGKTQSKTGGYRNHSHIWFRQPRDLPAFSFAVIRMMLIDPGIRLNLRMRAAPISGVQFAFKNQGKWVEGVQSQNPVVGEWVHRQLQRIWNNFLPKILRSQAWGWSAGEVTLKLSQFNLIEIDQLIDRHAGDCRKLELDGKPWGVRVDRVEGTGQVKLNFPYAWWHDHGLEDGAQHGMSILLGAYSPWCDKWLNGGGLDVRRLFMHKDAYGGVDLGYPAGSTFVEGVSQPVPNGQIADQVAQQLLAGGVTTRPSERDDQGNEMWPLTRASVPSNPAHILQYPKDLDDEIRVGMEIPDDVISNDGTGGWAGKRIPMAAFYASLDDWVSQIIVDLRKTLDPLILLNWGRAEEYEITHKPLAEQAMEQQSNAGPGEVQGNDSHESSNPYRMSLYSHRDAQEDAVGRGVLNAAELVQAARKVIDGRSNPVRMSWVSYEGERGGRGWRDTTTGEVRYQVEQPGEGAKANVDPASPKIDHSQATPEAFYTAVNKSRRTGFLTKHTPESIAEIIKDGGTVKLSNDGTSGYILTKDGDLQNVFNNGGPPGAGKSAIVDAIANGAKTLDCYEGFLPHLYSSFGFVAYQAEMFDDKYAPADYDFERMKRPDVIFMSYEGGVRDEQSIRERAGTYEGFVHPAIKHGYGKDTRASADKSGDGSRDGEAPRQGMGGSESDVAGRGVGVRKELLGGADPKGGD